MVRYSFLVRLSHPLLHAGLSRPLLDHPIRPRQHLRRNRHADLLRGFEIDSKLKLHRLLYGQVSGFSAFEYLIHIHRRAPEVVVRIWPITHEASSFDMYHSWINRWQPNLSCQVDKPREVSIQKWARRKN